MPIDEERETMQRNTQLEGDSSWDSFQEKSAKNEFIKEERQESKGSNTKGTPPLHRVEK